MRRIEFVLVAVLTACGAAPETRDDRGTAVAPSPVIVAEAPSPRARTAEIPEAPFTVDELREIYGEMREDIRQGRLDLARRRFEQAEPWLEYPADDPRTGPASDLELLGGFVDTMLARHAAPAR